MSCLKSGPTCWWIKYSSPLDKSNIIFWWWWWWCINCCCWCCCCCTLCNSFWRLSSSTLRCEFECFVSTNVGLAAGRYSGTSRPDLYLTPQALQSVFGPIGPVRHCGVLSVAQCKHFLPSPFPSSPLSFFFEPQAFTLFLPCSGGGSGPVGIISGSDVDSGGLSTRSREAQLHGAARDLLLRAFAGTAISGLNTGLLGLAFVLLLVLVLPWLIRFVPGWNWRVSDEWSDRAFIPDISCSFCRSSHENDSSTIFDSHSSSAKSSYC